jgi:hypothetical protein
MDLSNRDISTLAVDFDDVLFPCLAEFVAYCSKYNLAEGSIDNIDDTSFTNIFNRDEATCHELFKQFTNSQEWVDLHNVPPPQSCVNSLRDIKAAGYHLVVVSAREHRFRQLTQHFIDTFFSEIFDTIYLCNYYGVVDELNPKSNKFDVCKKLGCFALLDDNPKYIKEVEEKGLIGIPFGKNSWTVRHRELVKTEHIVENWEDLTVEFVNKIRN